MKTLTTDQMTTLFKTLTIFIDNRDPFTTENIINELKRDGDQFNGFYDDDGNCIVDDLYVEIDDAIDSLVTQFYPDFIAEERRVYVFEPEEEMYEDDGEDDWDEEEELIDEDIDDVNVDKEGNKLPIDNPSGVYDDTEDEEKRGPGWYKDPVTGEWDWDRDAAASAEYEEEMKEEQEKDNINYGINDHEKEYEFIIGKDGRINFGKKFLVKIAEFDDDAKVTLIGTNDDPTCFYIFDSRSNIDLTDNEYIIGNYQLKNGALRVGINSIIPDLKPGDTVYAKVHWPVMCTDDNLWYVYVYIK